MNRSQYYRRIILIVFVVASGVAMAAPWQRWRRDWRSIGRDGVPTWDVEKPFAKDVFTFVRIKYSSGGYREKWATDFRDSELNFSLRLQQMTTIQVNPEPIVLELTDPELVNYPFIYIIEPGDLFFFPEEITALRRYLLNGGFLMVDDFWGDDEYQNFYQQIKRVFPESEPQEVPLEHEIFHCVYDLTEKPQLPAIERAKQGAPYGITWEPSRDGSDTSKPMYRAIYDKAGRMMVFICHNTDLGDGWEREGENTWYFEEFSVKKAYPLGINIVTYAMTH
jgi:hypothetical protein